jgi:phosphoglycolate phosphatase
MNIQSVIFDFDGTIVNSNKGIQQAFNKAYLKVYGKENTVPVEPFIGPPLQEILFHVNGEKNIEIIDSFVTNFKSSYDAEDYKTSTLYDGIETVLEELTRKGLKLYIATNKRNNPTQLITKYLAIHHYFNAFYCNDMNGKSYSSKGEMLSDLLKKEQVDKEQMVLVGDTYQDQIAATQNKVEFIYADYGFGNLEHVEKTVSQPIEILKFIN